MTQPIYYGGDYNPEQWDEATVRQDIELMVQAGVNLVSLGIFSWAKLEPREGDYQLDWLGELLDQLHAAGIKVDLATGTASPPPWMARLYPETLPVTAAGVRLKAGSRQQYSPSSSLFRAKATALTRQMATRFGSHPAVVMWHVSNEYGCHIKECFSEESREAFRAWLWGRYGSIEALNQAWGTAFWSQTYYDFAEVEPPAPLPTYANPAQNLDWRRFSDHALYSCFAAEAAVLREVTPHIPVTTNFLGMFDTCDYWQWARGMDVISNDCYPDPADPRAAADFALNADLMRSLGGGRPFWLMEQTAGLVQWRARNSRKQPGQLKLWSLQQVARGADAILFFQWRQSVQGAETFHSAMLPHSGTQSPTWREVVDLGQSLKRLESVVGSRVRSHAGMLFDWDSYWARQSAIGPVEPATFQAVRGWYSTLFNAGMVVDFLPPADKPAGVDDVFPAAPTAHPVCAPAAAETGRSEGEAGGTSSPNSAAEVAAPPLIVVPAQFMLSTATAQRIADWARGGAQVIVGATTGMLDGAGVAQQGGYLSQLPEAGVRVLDYYPATGEVCAWLDEPVLPTETITARVSAPAANRAMALDVAEGPLRRAASRLLGGDGSVLQARNWAELLAVDEDTQVLATFRGGELNGLPAITRREVGKGAIWYVGTELDGAARAVVVAVAAAYARIPNPLAGLPAGVEAVRRGEALFLLNHADTTAQIGGLNGVELLTGEQVGGHVLIPGRSAAVVVPKVAQGH
ncbi:beta-galactosidase [Buchananella felis]|uniref:beta-galactosidase n=1 Tax=Buchananella felis TaxID=3231492 RepID=UPI0035275811